MMLKESLIDIYNREYGFYSILGNENSIQQIESWLESIQAKTENVHNCIVVSGHSGLGKSFTCNFLSNKYNFDVKHTYASETRNKAFFTQILKEPYNVEMKIINKQLITVKKRVLLIFDDADTELINLSYVVDYLKGKNSPKIPIIVICNYLHDSKISSLCPKNAKSIEFNPLTETHLFVLCNRLCNLHGIDKNLRIKFKNLKFIKNLIKESRGDARYFINNFQWIYFTINKVDNTPAFDNRLKKKEINTNIWDIFHELTNLNDLDVDDVVNMSMLESNWIVNGIYENYTDVFKDCFEDTVDMINYLSISDLFEKQYTYYVDDFPLTYANMYSKAMCGYSYYIKTNKNNFKNIDTLNFKFPSYYGRISNHRINTIATTKLYNKMSPFIGYQVRSNPTYSYFFKTIILKQTFDLLPNEYNKNHVENIITIILQKLSEYGLDLEDMYILLRPLIFSSTDLRKFLKAFDRRKLKLFLSSK